jgi:quercetin dioxygenase-like cupin family protein
MKRLALAAALFATPALAQPTPLGSPVTIDATLSGQPIRAPSGDLRVTVSRIELPVGGKLPAHKHPYARVAHVEQGRLSVKNLDTGETREVKAGDWVVDAIDQWHEAAVVGNEPVRLTTIDQAPPGAAVTVPRNP